MSTVVLDTITGKSTATTVTIGSTPVVSASANSMTIRGEGSNQTSIQQGLAKAWLNMNGTGTVAIRDSFNIASITDNGTGDHTGTFTTAMNNDDFVCSGEGGTESGGASHMFLCAHTKATGSARVTNLSDGGGAGDRNIHGWMLMGDLA